ncbi:hypothetical protein GUITHDRAFT_144543 [Guillardia theta CCMP2712]|uniref:Uncharacterized protein n=1 Tax=Guillardia theta (strain CCMP2712) TaxID=905079 RepID=L1IP33_GUITC|nr:hypothetical protein GUITHDRAFT_144543 [Guillardia theta CCMP2712]EKX38051.1 hypothetical protein GUITHDRAFT_144543 [Guillardia theta CCMP2712]|eukprot:XP_005825031.1 hypothetical protein GUITHDRAFT_144543 [Guillardia theta CCMP2712]
MPSTAKALRDARGVSLWGLCLCTCFLAVSLRAQFTRSGEVSLFGYQDDHRIFAPLEEFRAGSGPQGSPEAFGGGESGDAGPSDMHGDRIKMKLERLQKERNLLEKRKWDILGSLTRERDSAAIEVAQKSNELHRQRLDSALDRAKARQKRLHDRAQRYYEADQQARQKGIERYVSQSEERGRRLKDLDDLLVDAKRAGGRGDVAAVKQKYDMEVNRLIGELAVDASRVNNVEERDAMLGRIRELDELINRGPDDSEESESGASPASRYFVDDYTRYAANVRARAPVDPQGIRIIPVA